jgi:hypothetical protein
MLPIRANLRHWMPLAPNADKIVNRSLSTLLAAFRGSTQPGHLSTFGKIFHFMQNMTDLQPLVSVDVSMRKMEALRKLADMKKDARLTIRIPRELKDRIEGIDRVYGVALPKIANECLKAFCEYVEQKKQTPTFPLSISPDLSGGKTPDHGSLRGRRGLHDGHKHRT